ncbi:MAG: universal stress protein [Nitrososphaera sp.]|nr:universal stress protein [Nitrososphaera sp.]
MSIKKILVPIDGSDFSIESVGYAVKLAKMAGAEILAIHAVVSLPYTEHKSGGAFVTTYLEEAKRHAEQWFGQVKEMATKDGVQVSSETLFDTVSVADVIVNYANSHNVDLIVIGTRGRTGIKRVLLGSVANGVVSHASCPVLVVK